VLRTFSERWAKMRESMTADCGCRTIPESVVVEARIRPRWSTSAISGSSTVLGR
jgi:hypothetical protein